MTTDIPHNPSPARPSTEDFPLGLPGFVFSDLHRPHRLKDLHTAFWAYAAEQKPELAGEFAACGTTPKTKTLPQESEILIQTAHLIGDFVAKLFNVSSYTARIQSTTAELQPVFRFKRDFLNIRVFKRFVEPAVDDEIFERLDAQVKQLLSHEPSPKADPELAVAEAAVFLLDCDRKLKKETLTPLENQRSQNLCSSIVGDSIQERIQTALKLFEDWCVQLYVSPSRRQRIQSWVSFVRPAKLDYENLVHTHSPNPALPELRVAPAGHLRPRDGFRLTDQRMGTKEILREVDYCLYCHLREKDSCSKGFAEKDGGYKNNPLGISLPGCPLDERISEMHWLRKRGDIIGALAMIMLDNPMCPGTGHRICNDCMKGCIFQKQDPVNIPQNETGVLTEVLNLPYGVEIYGLLTRFNPLNRRRPYALPYNGNNVLVVGLGPAGYTLVHYLANEGFGVVGIDGLKLEPVDALLTGRGRAFPKPILKFDELKKELDERVLMGFGGVSEYGITVRWDKNFLGLIYLTLLRRNYVRFYGGTRFGGTLSLEDAWDLGFRHVALATGAGKPTLVPMKNNMARGVRKASDFLMSLQLTGAFKKDSLANLQVRLPTIVIGGGLTAIDTATETLAYYPVQVEKVLERFESLVREHGETTVWQMCDEEEKETLALFLEHGRGVREERRRAAKENRPPSFVEMCRAWGGVSVAYRKRLADSPAYRLNHEEVSKAMEEGIAFIENMNPREVVKDAYGSTQALLCQNAAGESVRLPARSIFVAAGTSPNTIYEREFPNTFALDERKRFFKKYTLHENEGETPSHWQLRPAESGEAGAFFLSHEYQGRFVSFYGDNHPDYAGNVVKAMASAKHGAPHVAKLFRHDIAMAERAPGSTAKFDELVEALDEALVPKVVRVNRLTPTIVEVIVKGRYAARKFEPGQFYRMQNYETQAHAIEGVRLAMEGLALTGAWVDREKDLLSMVVLEMGASSRLCSLLKPGDPVVVMGPTGTPSEIPERETVLLAGGGLGNAVLLSISRALHEKNCKVIYFAGYRKRDDLFMQKEIEEATDQMVWAVDRGEAIPTNRPQDLSFVGNIVQAMAAYAAGNLQSPPLIPFSGVDRILAIGSDRMMQAVSLARHGVLKPFLKADCLAIGSINSPMQCMMKEVCAQCLQRHVDPKTGEESFVFSCFNQDQELDRVDFANLNDRLKMNLLSEKLANLYLDRLFDKAKVERI